MSRQSSSQPSIPMPEEQAYVALQRSADRLQASFSQWLKPHALSPTQYNALRILRGAGESGLPCRQIGERMISRDPDITRLVDRLAKRGLVKRTQDGKDRRVVRAAITPAGREVLELIDGLLGSFLKQLLGHLGEAKLQQLVDLADAASAQASAPSENCP